MLALCFQLFFGLQHASVFSVYAFSPPVEQMIFLANLVYICVNCLLSSGSWSLFPWGKALRV